MQRSLSNSYTYVGGGDTNDLTEYVSTALLDVDFELVTASGLYRFKKSIQAIIAARGIAAR